MSTHTVSTENHLAPTFFGLCWCRLNSFVLVLLSSLKSFGFNTTVSWENTKVFTWVCLCIFIYASVVILLTLPTTYSFDISKFEYNTKLFSLFFSQREKLYTYIIYVVCSVVLLPTYIYYFFCRRISSSFTDSHRRACIFQIVFMLYII